MIALWSTGQSLSGLGLLWLALLAGAGQVEAGQVENEQAEPATTQPELAAAPESSLLPEGTQNSPLRDAVPWVNPHLQLRRSREDTVRSGSEPVMNREQFRENPFELVRQL